MKRFLWMFVLLAVACTAPAKEAGDAKMQKADPPGPAQKPRGESHHKAVHTGSLQWNPVLPGYELAVVSGPTDQPGVPFVLRIRAVQDADIPPHWHPGDEHVTVLTGEAKIGTGEKFDESKLTTYAAGDYFSMPAEMRHYGRAKKGTVMQVHGVGPFVVNLVEPPPAAKP